MPTRPNDGRREDLLSFRFARLEKMPQLRSARPSPARWRAGSRVAILSLGLALAFFPCRASFARTPVDQNKWGTLEGYAVWYEVPGNSLAKRRAGKNELTAAHNRLPLGTMVRVIHLADGKSVNVRITDRGITNRHALIDLCKEAAEKLGMIHEGSARVRLEVLSLDKGSASLGNSPSIATHR